MLAVAFAVLALVGVLAPTVYVQLRANLERVQMLRGLDLPVYERTLDEAAWNAGWRSLCSPGKGAEPASMPANERMLQAAALTAIDRGDYATAQALLQRLLDDDQAGGDPNLLAYRAALDLDWIGAAQAYPQVMTRRERWWGTVFYLAAQQRMFEGALDEAAELYRRADAAYRSQGPYLGLGLVDCLVQRGRTLEAWDAYRRALVVMHPEEALAHLSRFEELRLEALRVWNERDPANERVAHWLAFYEEEAQREPAEAVALEGEPVPQVSFALDLGGDRKLLGFDYRAEDLETGPFMAIDFYVREGAGEEALFRRVPRTVLNQAPNGAFAWDAVPGGVRPVGWHGQIQSHELAALRREEVVPGEFWVCLDARLAGTTVGLQGNTAPLLHEQAPYLQGGKVFPSSDRSLALGRIWFGVEDPYNYSWLAGGHRPDQVQFMVGTWEPVQGVHSAAVWLLTHHTNKACFRELYLFAEQLASEAER